MISYDELRRMCKEYVMAHFKVSKNLTEETEENDGKLQLC
jgi:hypothetical protein